MLRSIIHPLRGRVGVIVHQTSKALGSSMITPINVSFGSRRSLSIASNLQFDHLGRGPLSTAAFAHRKAFTLQPPAQSASIIRLTCSDFDFHHRLNSTNISNICFRRCSSNSNNDPPESLGEYVQVDGAGENIASQGSHLSS